jgi:hypothetical protein
MPVVDEAAHRGPLVADGAQHRAAVAHDAADRPLLAVEDRHERLEPPDPGGEVAEAGVGVRGAAVEHRRSVGEEGDQAGAGPAVQRPQDAVERLDLLDLPGRERRPLAQRRRAAVSGGERHERLPEQGLLAQDRPDVARQRGVLRVD